MLLSPRNDTTDKLYFDAATAKNSEVLNTANYCWALQLGELAWLLRDGPEAKQHEADHRERQNSW
jgi:hypothetical protein